MCGAPAGFPRGASQSLFPGLGLPVLLAPFLLLTDPGSRGRRVPRAAPPARLPSASQVPRGRAANFVPPAAPRVPLPPGVTFSDVVSATEPCKPCTECVGLQSMSAPCVEADDAVCRCAYGYYQDETTGRCEACRVCEAGSGLVFSCQDRQNTVCEECPDGTYSDEANHVDPCLPCTVCEDTERQLRECTRWADAECEGERAGPRSPPGGRGGPGAARRGVWGRARWPPAGLPETPGP